uniref:Uncharacterized protein n=1 Tax=Lactuca sativa TaxID=4236 RepID=A0A9R1WMD3_LACSA|nr:hypothetical protein LSAT_V11C100029740 [Lactuca sativa]
MDFGSGTALLRIFGISGLALGLEYDTGASGYFWHAKRCKTGERREKMNKRTGCPRILFIGGWSLGVRGAYCTKRHCLRIRSTRVRVSTSLGAEIEKLRYKFITSSFDYPLLLPYGDDGYRVDIPYRGVTSMSNNKHENTSMKEFFSYIIQERDYSFSLTFNSERIFQQLLVDAYTIIESERLYYIEKSTQRSLVIKGVKIFSEVGQRWCTLHEAKLLRCHIVPEVQIFLKDTTLNPDDIADILCKLFKIKINALIKDLRENAVFGMLFIQLNFKNVVSLIFISIYLCNTIISFLRSNTFINLLKLRFPMLMKIFFPKNFYDHTSIYKDATIIVVQNKNECDNDDIVDEIKEHYDCRYLSACEVSWQIYGYDIHYRYRSMITSTMFLRSLQSPFLCSHLRRICMETLIESLEAKEEWIFD